MLDLVIVRAIFIIVLAVSAALLRPFNLAPWIAAEYRRTTRHHGGSVS